MGKVRNNHFNYLAMVKDKETGELSRKKMYKTINEIITDYEGEYSVSNVKNRCHRTKNGIVKNGLLIYSVRVSLDDPSILLKYKDYYNCPRCCKCGQQKYTELCDCVQEEIINKLKITPEDSKK